MVTVTSMFNNLNTGSASNNPAGGASNLLAQARQCQQNPNAILDILAQAGKIDQQQYQELQQYNGNAQQIAQYLIGQNQGYANAINQIIQQLNQIQK